MDWTMLQVTGLILLGWLALSLLVGSGMALFMHCALAKERLLPTDEAGLRAWMRGEQPLNRAA